MRQSAAQRNQTGASEDPWPGVISRFREQSCKQLRQRAVGKKDGAEQRNHDLRAGQQQRRTKLVGVEGRTEGETIVEIRYIIEIHHGIWRI